MQLSHDLIWIRLSSGYFVVHCMLKSFLISYISHSGTYHAFDHAKYAHRYLYRFNRRFDWAVMVLRLLRAAVNTNPLLLSILRVSEAGNQSGKI